MVDLVDKAIYELGLNDASYVKKANAVAHANEAMANSFDAAASSEENLTVVTQKASNNFAKIEAQHDRLAKIEQTRQNQLEKANRVADEERTSLHRRTAAIDNINKKYDAQVEAIRRVAQEQQRLNQMESAARASAAQGAFNAQLGVRSNFGGAEQSAAVFAAQAREIDNLRARYVPLIAVQQQYEAELADINRLLVLNEITTEQAAAAVTRSTTAYNQQLRQGVAGSKQFGMAVQQAGFQVGDFAVQVAGGQGVLRPFIQQFPQLLGVLGGAGTKLAMLSSIGGAVVAVAGALALTFWDFGDATGDAEKAQDAFNDTLDRASDLLDEVNGKAKRNAASLMAEMRNLAGIADLSLRNADRAASAASDELGAVPRASSGGRFDLNIVARNSAQNKLDAAQEESKRLQAELNQIKASLGVFGDGRSNMGKDNSDSYVNQAEAVAKLNRELEKEIELLRLSESQRAIATDVDDSLSALGLTRETAPEETLKHYTDIATAKQRQIELNEAAKKSEKEAEQTAKEAAAERKRIEKDRVETAEKFAESYSKLREKIDPTIAAENALNRELMILDMALERGLIPNLEQYNREVEQVYRNAEAALDPYKKLTDAQAQQARTIQGNTAALSMNDEERAVYLARLAAENKLLADGRELTDSRSQSYIAQEEALARASYEFDRAQEKMKAGQQVFEQFFDQSFDRIGGGITEALATGQIEMAKLGDIGRAVVSELMQLFMQLAITNPLKNLALGQDNPVLGDVVGSLFSGIGSWFGGGIMADPNGAMLGRAGGGRVKAGQSYWVGESGPEPFTPSQDGYIEPNWSAMRGANSNGPNIINIIEDHRGSSAPPVEQRQSRRANGDIEIRTILREMVNQDIQQGKFDNSLGSRFGVIDQPKERRG